MKAFCFSEECNGITEMGKKSGRTEVFPKPGSDICPNPKCGSFVMWMKEKTSKIMRVGNSKEQWKQKTAG